METELIKDFLKQNPNIVKQIGNFPIDRKKAISLGINSSTIDKVRYVSKNEFQKLVQELCIRYNEVKNKDDIYVLLYTPFFDMTGTLTYKNKSNFYTTNIAGQFLKFDYIFDLTNENTKDKLGKIILDKISKIKATSKNIYLYICDDCSYSGKQIHELIINLVVSKFIFTLDEDSEEIINPNIYIRLIIPFILNQLDSYLSYSQITDNIKNRLNKKEFTELFKATNEKYIMLPYSTKMHKDWDKSRFDNMLASFTPELTLDDNIWIENIISLYKNKIDTILLIDIEPIKDILIRNKKTVGNINKSSSSWLIYFDHKLADHHSVDLSILSRIIKNCKIGDTKCPEREYSKIKYYFNEKEFIFKSELSFSKNIMDIILNGKKIDTAIFYRNKIPFLPETQNKIKKGIQECKETITFIENNYNYTIKLTNNINKDDVKLIIK
jgi:hypothetical protein